MAKKPTEQKVKCPGCHAYFVDKGEVCANCEKKAAKKPAKEADTTDEE